jgi:WS/DGAT/MGAT family acyltransferase
MVTRTRSTAPSTEVRQRQATSTRNPAKTPPPASAPVPEPTLRTERMSKVDTAWLRMDSRANLMMILGVWILKPAITYEALCQRVSERLLKYPRFMQCAVEDSTGASWVPDAHFDLVHHVVREQLSPPAAPQAGGKRRAMDADTRPARQASASQPAAAQALQQRVAELAVQPLDRNHPLWQFHLVEDHDGGSALIARIHHCIADGMALIAVMMSLVDGGSEPPQRRNKKGEADEDDSLQAWLTQSMLKPLTQLAVKALDTAGDSVAHTLGLLAEPRKSLHDTVQGTLGLARLGGQVASDLAALALMPDDARTSLKAPPAATKAVAWCEPISLDEVKAVGKALGCSVNDVLLSCVAGALGAYLQQCGETVAGKEIRAMVPVNLRPLDQAWKLGNRFGLVPLVLPIGLDNPIERLLAVRARMQALKGSTQPLLAFGLLAVAGLLVKPAQELVLGLFSRKTTAVMTNVPGPASKLQFCDSTLEQTMFWVPQSGDIGVGVSILSYGGGVQFGLITDTAMCPEPERVIAQFAPQFQQLTWLSLLLPWGEPV